MQPQQQTIKKKRTTIYWVLIAGPIVALVLTSILQVVIRFITAGSGDGGGVSVFVNLVSLLVGVLSVLSILLLPLWIILLVQAYSHNKKLMEQQSAPVQATQSQGKLNQPQRPM